MIKRTKPRSVQSQLGRMEKRWPELRPRLAHSNQLLAWVGPLRGFQMSYTVQIQWKWQNSKAVPLAFICEPKLRPREGEDFIDLPHLRYNSDKPEDSALCLYDPDTGEWKNTMLIADTTVPWVSEWLHHYEIWHLDGTWHGANAPGPISIREMIALELDETDGART